MALRSSQPARRNTLLDHEEPIGVPSKRRTLSGIQGHPGEYAPRRVQWRLDADKIIEKLKSNKTFQVGSDFDPQGLPIFADLSRYGVSEEKQLELFSLEIRRLVDVINSGEPVHLEGEPEWFGQADTDGYRRLDKLAIQADHAIAICIHDLELQMLEHHPKISMPDKFRQARETLLESFGHDAPHDAAKTWSEMRICDHNDEAFHAVVNYLTSTLMQILLRAMSGEFWDDNCVISMAKSATKIKVVAMDLVNAAETSLAGKREWMQSLKRITDREPDPLPQDQDNNTAAGYQTQARSRCIVVRAQKYFHVMHSFGSRVLFLLKTAIKIGRSGSGVALPPDAFESCSIVYSTGFRGRRSILCQERNSAIGVSGSRDETHCASFAFEVCLNSLKALQKRRDPEGLATTSKSAKHRPTTLVYWKWTELRSELDDLESEDHIFHSPSQTGQVVLTSMSDVIEALIPYSTVCGRFSSTLSEMVEHTFVIVEHGVPLSMCMETRFLASFLIQTSEHESFRARSLRDGPDVTCVSKCPIAEHGALAQGPMSSTLAKCETMPDDHLRSQLLQKNKTINAGLEMMDYWTLDTSSITIRSRWYCWGTLTFCGALILGGLCIGFTVNERIRGVDPFNISLFCWALAGFTILFVKSLRVENWPWRDFFRGRVVCKSVSEVISVTGIDQQLFLSILLQLEPVVKMNKQGPFRAPFIQTESGEAGFSVDVPLSTASLADAGFFFIKVQSINGPALVAIRASPKSGYDIVNPHSFSKDGELVNCQRLSEPGRWGGGEKQRNMYGLSTDTVIWSKVIGMFWEEAYFC